MLADGFLFVNLHSIAGRFLWHFPMYRRFVDKCQPAKEFFVKVTKKALKFDLPSCIMSVLRWFAPLSKKGD